MITDKEIDAMIGAIREVVALSAGDSRSRSIVAARKEQILDVLAQLDQLLNRKDTR